MHSEKVKSAIIYRNSVLLNCLSFSLFVLFAVATVRFFTCVPKFRKISTPRMRSSGGLVVQRGSAWTPWNFCVRSLHRLLIFHSIDCTTWHCFICLLFSESTFELVHLTSAYRRKLGGARVGSSDFETIEMMCRLWSGTSVAELFSVQRASTVLINCWRIVFELIAIVYWHRMQYAY